MAYHSKRERDGGGGGRESRDRDRGGRDEERRRAPARSGGRSKGGFTYRPRSEESVKARAERQGGSFDKIFKDGIDTWTADVGDNVVRILPPTWEDHDHYGYTVWVHGWVGPDNSSYLCPRKMNSKRCPICEAARDAKDAGETEEEKALKPQERILCWIVDRDDKDLLPMVWNMSWTQDREINSICYIKRTGKIILIDHPDEGFDLSFKRQGTKLNTKYYGWQVDRDPSPISDDQKEQDRILDYVLENPIPSILNFYDDAYLEQMLTGTVAETDKDLDDSDRDGEPRDEPRRRDDRRSGGRNDEERPARRVSEGRNRDMERAPRHGRDEPEEELPAEEEDDRGRRPIQRARSSRDDRDEPRRGPGPRRDEEEVGEEYDPETGEMLAEGGSAEDEPADEEEGDRRRPARREPSREREEPAREREPARREARRGGNGREERDERQAPIARRASQTRAQPRVERAERGSGRQRYRD